ncbi:ThiF family adenylyltransferase [Streptomyces sp. Qhu-G9]|uniref:ThiF family adenylyltransferase n=1 Tax=Streptomyces sp. Qhu-G9 TaxID=3452799 RepID=UPI0022AC445F|nr:ThiF family adenylyltransferase [Streptomyces aurantiacus]WAU81405.1 ThiF family adenylyltransferase [Streptomyces aurantiacus]
MSRRNSGRPGAPTSWQKKALADLRTIAAEQPDILRVVGAPERTDDGAVAVTIEIDTKGTVWLEGGLLLQPREQFVMRIPPHALLPPQVDVTHTRFLGHPHVLQGHRLCLYLDPAREWNPADGIRSSLDRLWGWLSDAAGNRFDASTALYHAVGGVLHQSAAAPTIVVREPVPPKNVQAGYLIPRTVQRLDLTFIPREPPAARLPVITAPAPLPMGAGTTLVQLLQQIDASPGSAAAPFAPAVLTSLVTSVVRNADGTPQYFLLAVPHPAGGPPHLIAGRIPATAADELRDLARRHPGSLNKITPSAVNPTVPIEWCRVSDERQAVTTRRDASRPVNNYQDKHVHIWGCGGIGSWTAEFIARAGAAHITLCDPGVVTGGLLVRQNFLEIDIGETKAAALADRLRNIDDNLTVDIAKGILPDDAEQVMHQADLVIDATISLAIGQALDVLARTPDRKATLAQIATDTRTGTLGILTACAPDTLQGPHTLDSQVGLSVLGDHLLELYHPLWQESEHGDELVPTRGCSVPTFHGSSADLAAVAATLTTFLGMQMAVSTSGTHLIALPHAHSGPHHHYVPPTP